MNPLLALNAIPNDNEDFSIHFTTLVVVDSRGKTKYYIPSDGKEVLDSEEYKSKWFFNFESNHKEIQLLRFKADILDHNNKVYDDLKDENKAEFLAIKNITTLEFEEDEEAKDKILVLHIKELTRKEYTIFKSQIENHNMTIDTDS